MAGVRLGLVFIIANFSHGFFTHQWVGFMSFRKKEGSCWMWHSQLEWIWTDISLFPYFLINSIQSWAMLVMEKIWRILFVQIK